MPHKVTRSANPRRGLDLLRLQQFDLQSAEYYRFCSQLPDVTSSGRGYLFRIRVVSVGPR